MELDPDTPMDTDIDMIPAEEKEFDITELPVEYQDREHNYQLLIDTLRELREWNEFPKDWLKAQKRHIEIYAQVIPMFRMSTLMEDRVFQAIVHKIETSLACMIEGLRNKQLVLDAYEDFIENLIKALEMNREMVELEQMMGNL